MSRLTQLEAAVKFYREAEARAGVNLNNSGRAFSAEDKREMVRLLEASKIGSGSLASAMGISYKSKTEYALVTQRIANFQRQVDRERAGGGNVVSIVAVRQPVAAPVVRHVKAVTLDGKLAEIKAARRKLEEKIDEITVSISQYEAQEKVLEAAVELLK